MIKGIDVSGWNGEVYSAAGSDFVFIKATEGTTYTNPKMRRQAATARTAGLAVGFYHFLHGGNIKQQAAYFVQQCASVEGDMLVCDWETPPVRPQDPATNTEKDAFLHEVKRLRPGHKVGLYCNTDYWLHRDRTSYAADFLWIADPNHPAGHPAIKATWMFHQYGVISGVDRNVGAFQSRAALRAWCGYPTPKPPAPAPPPAPQPTAYDKRQDLKIDQLAADVKKLSQS
jgi:GH25 family lysozyme M1 (1,4-beta-N-acetylmuramidase)